MRIEVMDGRTRPLTAEDRRRACESVTWHAKHSMMVESARQALRVAAMAVRDVLVALRVASVEE